MFFYRWERILQWVWEMFVVWGLYTTGRLENVRLLWWIYEKRALVSLHRLLVKKRALLLWRKLSYRMLFILKWTQVCYHCGYYFASRCVLSLMFTRWEVERCCWMSVISVIQCVYPCAALSDWSHQGGRATLWGDVEENDSIICKIWCRKKNSTPLWSAFD